MRVAGVVIKNNADEILLLHRATERLTHYEIPGGKIEPKESAAAAATREAYEELGTTVDIVRELGSTSSTDAHQEIHYTWFLSAISGQAPQVAEPQKFDEVRYWSLDELREGNIPISSGTRSFLEGLRSGQFRM